MPQSPDSLSPGITQHKSTNERSHSMSALSNGHLPYSIKEKEPKSAGGRLIGNGILDELRGNSVSGSGNNNNNNNFKVPSGKEGSLKHRILTTRPHDNNAKHGTINHPANR
jgi:hypothetical protein